jgi:hypothetical protein
LDLAGRAAAPCGPEQLLAARRPQTGPVSAWRCCGVGAEPPPLLARGFPAWCEGGRVALSPGPFHSVAE